MSQILVPGVEFCQEGVVGLGHGGRLRGFAPVAFHIVLHRGEPRVFAPVAFRIVPHAALHIVSHGCESWIFAPVVLLIELHVCRSGPSAPVAFHECCPELRQEPA